MPHSSTKTRVSAPLALSAHEIKTHEEAINEYADEIYQVMGEALEANRPNIGLYRSQPFITPYYRLKLVDFALKLLVRLKILPFVFMQGVKIFDRYCLCRIVVLAHAELAISTCLWIAAKLAGGNIHFANSNSLTVETKKPMSDSGLGSGAGFLSLAQRFRRPRLCELVNLCGPKNNYDASMFVQMELHILTVLKWNYSVPCISDYIISSSELRITSDGELLDSDELVEMYRIKRFAAYASCYLLELVDYSTIQVAAVLLDLVNDSFLVSNQAGLYQSLRGSSCDHVVDYKTYYHVRRHLEHAIRNASMYLLRLFDSRGPQLFYSILCSGINRNGLGSPLPHPSLSSSNSTEECFAIYKNLSSDTPIDEVQDVLSDLFTIIPAYLQPCAVKELRSGRERNRRRT